MIDYKKYALLSMSCLLLALVLSMSQVREDQENLADRLSPSLLRFHILANSDSSEDQQVKLEVRSLILDYMQEHLDGEAGKEETIQYLQDNKAEVEQLAGQYLSQQGYGYQANLELTNCYFPTRVYDDMVFPCGYYDAARITLGSGAGHNWWCVLYPRLCFVDAACSEVPEETEQTLLKELAEGDYLALRDNRPKVEIRFLMLPFFNPTPARRNLSPPTNTSPLPAADPNSLSHMQPVSGNK